MSKRQWDCVVPPNQPQPWHRHVLSSRDRVRGSESQVGDLLQSRDSPRQKWSQGLLRLSRSCWQPAEAQGLQELSSDWSKITPVLLWWRGLEVRVLRNLSVSEVESALEMDGSSGRSQYLRQSEFLSPSRPACYIHTVKPLVPGLQRFPEPCAISPGPRQGSLNGKAQLADVSPKFFLPRLMEGA